jgi:HEAT repeat protein
VIRCGAGMLLGGFLLGCGPSAALRPEAGGSGVLLQGKPVSAIPPARASILVDSLGRRAKTNARARNELVSALAHPDKDVGARAAWWLIRVGEPAVRPLTRVLSSGVVAAQQRAAYALGSIGPPAARDAAVEFKLAALLASEDERLAVMANWALKRIAPKSKVPGIRTFRALRFGRGPARTEALADIGWLGTIGVTAFPIVTRMLADSNDYIRETAARALVRAGPSTLPQLEKGLRSSDPAVRVRSMLVMTSIGSRLP